MDARPALAHTPLKSGENQAQFKTPLRTPLSVLEQKSSTPITPFEAIESQKENVQPRARGRSAHALSTTLSMHHKERQETLAAQRREWEERVNGEENQDSDDPLEVWCSYVKWCIDNYPEGKSSESGIVPLLERVTRLFRESEQYQNDSRYLRLWILYAQHTDVPRDVFQFLLSNEIGTKLASLYEELANVLESHEVYDEADDTYKLGIARRASPLDRLKRRYNEYQARILALPESSSSSSSSGDGGPTTYAKALAAAMARAGRSVLGVKTGRGAESVPTNVLGTHQPLSSSSGSMRPNARTMQVYCDDENDMGPPKSSSGSHAWTNIGTAAARRKENQTATHSLKPLTPGGRVAQTPRSQARALEVFCDSDEDASPRRTPRRDDVFQRHVCTESDKLRKNPFLHYDSAALEPPAAPKSQATIVPPPAPPAVTMPASRHASRERTHAAPNKKRIVSSKPVRERHAVPLQRLYPDADLTAAVQDKARPIPPTREMCLEELYAQHRSIPTACASDPWAFLDAWQGRWMPELVAVTAGTAGARRAPSPTLVTKAAILEVDHMFNGESDSNSEDDDDDDDDDDESETDDDDVRYPVLSNTQDENVGIQPTPIRPRVDRQPFGATPQQTPRARNIARDEDDEDDVNDDEPSSLSASPRIMPRTPFQPLTPITERTERTEHTEGSVRTEHTDRMEPNERTDLSVCASPQSNADVLASTAEQPFGGLHASPATLDIPNPCSPADPDIVTALLSNLRCPLASRPGYIDEAQMITTYLPTLTSRVADAQRLQSSQRRSSVSTACDLNVADMQLSVCMRLGEGGFGSVFLAQDMNESVPLAGETTASYEDVDADDVDELERRQMLALKIESPPNPWEFYILDELRRRLPAPLQASVVGARRFVACANESLLLLEYASKGTLLELVNHASTAGVGNVLGHGGGVEEVLAMFFVIELCRVVEGMHNAGLLHGDLKIDNCMIRADDVDEWTSTYAADGSGGWSAKGVTLIDFGRAVDMRCFVAEQRFLADWQPGAQDCVEMREMRPWTYQADYYGLASIAYCLLFGKYMETTSYVNEDGQKTYKIQQTLRRYWQTDLWTRFFHLLLNPTHAPMWPVTPLLAELRHDMEVWLAAHSFHAGKNLKGLLKKVEIWALRHA